MNKKVVTIDGNKFSSLPSFYDEIERELTRNLDWRIGRNLNAFNDVLRGGFGVYEYEEPIKLTWLNSDKSRMDFGWEETIKYLSAKLTTCHPSNVKSVAGDLELAKSRLGQTLFDILLEIIKEHDHIELMLQ